MRGAKAPPCFHVSGGANWIFYFAIFNLLLAFNAIRRPGHSVQTSLADGVAAMQTLSVASLANSLKGQADQRQLRMTCCPLGEQQLLLVGRHCLIGDILRCFSCGLTALFYRGEHVVLQHCLLLAQFFSKTPYIGGNLCHVCLNSFA